LIRCTALTLTRLVPPQDAFPGAKPRANGVLHLPAALGRSKREALRFPLQARLDALRIHAGLQLRDAFLIRGPIYSLPQPRFHNRLALSSWPPGRFTIAGSRLRTRNLTTVASAMYALPAVTPSAFVATIGRTRPR
jgi:hypothetical protein